MDTRLLRSFLAVTQSGSFTDAAIDLGYTQSAVTAHVQKLERQLGHRLLDRLPSGVVVTNVGAETIFHAEEVVAAEDRLRVASAKEGSRPSGTVRLMAPETLCTYWLPTVIGAVRRSEPDIQVWVSPGGIAEAIDSVRRGTVELAVTMEPHVPPTDMSLAQIGTQSLLFLDQADAVDDPRDAAPMTWAALAERDALLIEGCGYSDHVTDQLASTGRRGGRRSRFGSVEAIKRCVGVGLGWTVLPMIAVESEIRSGMLSVLQGPVVADCEVHLVSHPRRYQSSAVRVVIDQLRNSWPPSS